MVGLIAEVWQRAVDDRSRAAPPATILAENAGPTGADPPPDREGNHCAWEQSGAPVVQVTIDASPARHILVVEDEPSLRAVLTLVLESEGYAVTMAANGEEALGELQGFVPDAIVLDLMMPVMDGWALIEACRADPTIRTIPIIAMSAVRRGPVTEQLDVQAFLGKPFDVERVLDILQDVLR